MHFSKSLVRDCDCIYALDMYGVPICSPAYADDLTVMSLSCEGLQATLSVAYKYSAKWRFKFNPAKCSVMIFGDKKENYKFRLGKCVIKESKCEVLLGTLLTRDKAEEQKWYDDKIGRCKTMLYAAQSIGNHIVPVTPVTTSKLYWGAIIPKLCYGIEIADVNNVTNIELEKFHCDAAKHCQGLPQNTANYGAIVTMGWKSLKAHFDILKLLFMWRLLLLPMTCIYKKIILYRIMYIFLSHGKTFTGPTSLFIEICKKYNLYYVLKKAVVNGDFMNIDEWKKMVKLAVIKKDQQRITIQCSLYKVLDYLNPTCRMSVWWQHAFKTPTFSRINRSVLRLLLNVERHGFKYCEKCNFVSINTIEHMFFDCTATKEVRELNWSKVTELCPKQLVTEMEAKSKRELCVFILNGLNCDYVDEWKDIYSAISLYVYYL